MSQEYVDFIEQYRVTKKDKNDNPDYTHTSLGNPMGKFNIPREKYGELYRLIADSVFKQSMAVHLSERPYKTKALVVDFDFKFNMDVRKRQYTETHLKKIVSLFNEAIRYYVNVSDNSDMKAYVFEKPKPTRAKGNMKDGFHIIYPHVITHVNNQHLIRNYVLDKVEKIISDPESLIPYKNSVNDVVDEAVVERNNWMIYGCSKMGYDPYKLTHLYKETYDEDYDQMIIKDLPVNKFKPDRLISLFSTHREDEKCTYVLKDSRSEDLNELLESKDTNSLSNRVIRQKFISRKKKAFSSSDKKTIEEAGKLVQILEQYRADEYEHWIATGWCLHNISDHLLDTWIEFSRRSPKFTEGECEEEWAKFEDRGLGIGSLHHWAREDNPEEYNKLKQEFLSGFVSRSVNGTSQEVAAVFCEMFKHQFKVTYQQSNRPTFYEFKNHKWTKCDGDLVLLNKMSNDLINIFLSFCIQYNQNAMDTDDPDEKEKFTSKSQAIHNVINKIKDIGFKTKIVRECAHMLYEKDFADKLDSNPYLLGFENGVYDLKNGIFRNGNPDDYISMSVGHDFVEDMEEPEYLKYRMEVLKFLSEIFPNPEQRDYVMTFLSTCLEGVNPHEKLHIFIGSGGNGKSKLVELVEDALGGYAGKIPTALLVNKQRNASSNASPEIMAVRKKRFVSFEELNEGEKFNTGIMKTMTGNDKQTGRNNYGDQMEFRTGYKMLLCTNNKPELPADDGGVWRRIVLVTFMASFTDNPDPNNPNQFPIDPYLAHKMKNWREAFMGLLLEYYKEYRKVGKLIQPECVRAETEDYRKQNDIYEEFIQDIMEQTNDLKDSIQLDESYIRFRDWFSETQNKSVALPKRRDYFLRMKTKLGDYNKRKGWVGWRIKNVNQVNAGIEIEDEEIVDK